MDEINLGSLNGSDGFVIRGINSSDNAGRSVSSAGDINGDGIDDLIIGAPDANSGSGSGGYYYYGEQGESYVVFGSSDGFAESLDLADLDGSNGFVLSGIDEYDFSGRSVSGAGDVNGDGIDDLIIGAPYAEARRSSQGESYVVFGSDAGFAANLSLADLDGSNGFVLRGIDSSDDAGRSVSGAGDVNGDGIDDLIIGAPDAEASRNNQGESYVVFGFRPLELIGTEGDDILTGGDRSDLISGLGGDDVLEGNGGSDEILGGSEDDFISGGTGNDTVQGQSGDDDISGNEGNDSLSGDGGNDDIFGNSGDDTILGGLGGDRLFGGTDNDNIDGGIGNDRIFGGSGNDLITGNLGVDQISGQDGNDSLNGDLGNDILEGNNGDDLITGDSGADEIEGNNGDDSLTGGNGNDLLTGGNGSDSLFGDSENDSLTGGRGNDSLNGGSDNDLLIGIDTTDSDFGLDEQDTLTGGAGSDLFVLANENALFYNDGNNARAGRDDFATITDFDSSQDTIQLQGSADLYSLDFFAAGAETTNARLIFDPGVAAVGEVIAVLENVDPSLSVDDSSFTFV